jgi:hypothetical protein
MSASAVTTSATTGIRQMPRTAPPVRLIDAGTRLALAESGLQLDLHPVRTPSPGRIAQARGKQCA